MKLTPDMSLTEILAAVAAGQVVVDGRERSADIGTVWTGPDGASVTSWDRTGERIEFLSQRRIVRLCRNGRVVLTELGWRRFEQLVTQRLIEQERDQLVEAAAVSSYLGTGVPPRRWTRV